MGDSSYEAGFVYSNEGAKRLRKEELRIGRLRTSCLFRGRTIISKRLNKMAAERRLRGFVYRSLARTLASS